LPEPTTLPEFQRRVDVAWSPRLFALVAPALAMLAHAPALWSALVWDDKRVADQVVFFRSLADVFLPPAGIPGWSDAYYRPVVILSYLLDFRWLDGRAAAWVPHLSNLLFHATTTAFVWLLARRCFAARREGAELALSAAVIFAVHPIHAESVNWISGRSDVLATMFLLPAALLALRWRDARSPAALGGAMVLLLLALLAKEVALAGLVLLPAAWLLVPAVPGRTTPSAPPARATAAIGVAALLAVLGIYFLMRHGAVATYGTRLDIGPVVFVIGLTRVLAYYVVKLVVPWPQCNLVLWEMLPAWSNAIPLLLLVAALAAWAGLYWRRSGDGGPLFAITWSLAGIAPSLWIAFVFTATGPVAERYLYLSSIGSCLGVAMLLGAILTARGRAAASAAAALICAVYLGSTLERGLVWSSDVRLWSDATARMPGRAFQWASLARAWRAAGNYEAAHTAYQRGLEAEQDKLARAKVIYGIAELHLERGEFNDAEREFMRAQREYPAFIRPEFGLGLVYMQRAREGDAERAGTDRARAIRHFESVSQQDPDLLEARLALAQVIGEEADALDQAGAHAAARARYRTALAMTDEVLARLPPPQLGAYLRVAEAAVERDVVVMRARLAMGAQ
jgi:hypothetical protein